MRSGNATHSTATFVVYRSLVQAHFVQQNVFEQMIRMCDCIIWYNLLCLLQAFGPDNESRIVDVILSISYQPFPPPPIYSSKPKVQCVSAFHVV
jgi:hypothetical protein